MSTSTKISQDSLVITRHQLVYCNPVIFIMPILNKKMYGMDYIIHRIGLYTSISEKLEQYWENRLNDMEQDIRLLHFY